MTKIRQFAAYILKEYQAYHITPMKLQKLLYYLYVWSIVKDGGDQALFPEMFKRWQHGPVNVDIYHQYKEYGNRPIPAPTEAPIPQDADKAFIDFVLLSYVHLSAIELSSLTHQEDPWKSAHDYIFPPTIKRYYSKQSFAKNFHPFDPQNNPYYMVRSDSWYAFTLDMNHDDQDRFGQYPSFRAYLEVMSQARKTTDIVEQNLARLG